MATICCILTAKPRLQIADFLDDCTWCKEKSRYTEPLDIGEWHVKCKRVPKPIWFNHKLLGRTHGSSVYLKKDMWLYSKQYGWVYKLTVNDNQYYIHTHGWVYINRGMLYSYATQKWYSIKLLDKHKLVSIK